MDDEFLICEYSEDSHRHAMLVDDGITGILYLHAPSDDAEKTGEVVASCFAYNRVDPIDPQQVQDFRAEERPDNSVAEAAEVDDDEDDEIVFDKAKWHYEGKFPRDLDEEQGFVHTGMFLGWIIEAGLYSEDFADDFKSEIRKFKARKLTGTGVYAAADGVFDAEMLNREGVAFAKAYFDLETGKYLKDYDKLLTGNLPSTYHVQDTWENYDLIKSQIDKRFAAWKKKRKTEK